VNATRHCIEELPALLHGELPLDELRRVTTHLRTCVSCQRELVEVATGVGALARVERQGLVDDARPQLPPLAELPPEELPDAPVDLDAARRRRPARWLVPVAAAVVALVVASAAILVTRDDSSPSAPTAQVALRPVGSQPARGEVEMSGRGGSRTMVVSANLPPASAKSYYEVWLLDTRTNGMVAVGVLPASGTAHFTLPSDLVARYNTVDLSLQPDNGVPTHSNQSVLRARYA
jgi:hypothetical protein